MIPPERRRLSRLLTRLADASVPEALALVPSQGKPCRRVGITGPPGAGKSTLLAALAPHRLRGDADLAIIAIDPTSPVSGGAILGDRIRMEALATEPRIYIRSLASRGATDGLADNLHDILAALDGFTFDEVLVETVGVGQVEYAIRDVVDTLVLVLTPGAGDQIQAMKSGIIETADIFVINKADLPGARQFEAELKSVLNQRSHPEGGWHPPILQASIRDGAAMALLSAEIDRHQGWGRGRWHPRQRRLRHASSLLARRLQEVLRDLPPMDLPVAGLFAEILSRLLSPDGRGHAPPARPPPG